jgi:tyramine---L-glutamate ligase
VKILLYEHASGGGLATADPSVLCEGYGMLRAVASDLKKAGHQVTVLLDANLLKLNPPLDADFVVPVFSPSEPQRFLAALAMVNDAIYVTAPETSQTLQSLVQTVEKTSKISLNCPSEAIGKASNKAVLYDSLKKLGLPALETVSIKDADSLSEIKRAVKGRLGFPLVLKPLDGVSCGGLCLIKDKAQLEAANQKTKTGGFIAQKYLKGTDASVSLLCTGTEALPISLNRQNIVLAGPDSDSSYMGGCVPFNHPKKKEAFDIAQKIAVYFGLRGYVGVDFVLTDEDAFAVDVNPRLTTSYVGLSKTSNINIAQGIVDAVLKKKLPKKPELHGYACFSKIQTPNPQINQLKKTFKIPEVISPPFPNVSGKTCALVCGCCADSEANASFEIQEAKKHLLSIIIGQGKLSW